MRPQRRLAPRWLSALAGILVLAHAGAVRAADPPRPADAPASGADAADGMRLGLLLGEQVARLNPGAASADNSVSNGGLALGADLDFKAMSIPITKTIAGPVVFLSGRVLASDRAIAQAEPIPGDTTGRDTLRIVPSTHAIELVGAFRIAYPIESRGGVPVSRVYFKAEAGSIFTEGTRADMLDVLTYAIGFERTSGTFAGSFVDLGYGRDGTFGAGYAGSRYKVHVLVQGDVMAAAGATRQRGGLDAFAELEVDTDNQGGPDGLRALLGVKLDGAGLLRGMGGFIGGVLGTE
jgi:hypothetical protein